MTSEERETRTFLQDVDVTAVNSCYIHAPRYLEMEDFFSLFFFSFLFNKNVDTPFSLHVRLRSRFFRLAFRGIELSRFLVTSKIPPSQRNLKQVIFCYAFLLYQSVSRLFVVFVACSSTHHSPNIYIFCYVVLKARVKKDLYHLIRVSVGESPLTSSTCFCPANIYIRTRVHGSSELHTEVN